MPGSRGGKTGRISLRIGLPNARRSDSYPPAQYIETVKPAQYSAIVIRGSHGFGPSMFTPIFSHFYGECVGDRRRFVFDVGLTTLFSGHNRSIPGRSAGGWLYMPFSNPLMTVTVTVTESARRWM